MLALSVLSVESCHTAALLVPEGYLMRMWSVEFGWPTNNLVLIVMEKYRRANAYITIIANVEHVSGFKLTIDYSYHIDGLVQDCNNSNVLALELQYIPRNMHTVFALLCFIVVIHWLIFPYPSGLLHWHCGNLTIAPVPAKQPWWIWINTSCEFIMNDCITTTKQSTTKPRAYFLGYTVLQSSSKPLIYGIVQ